MGNDVRFVSGEYGLRKVILNATRELRVNQNSVARVIGGDVIEEETVGRFGHATGSGCNRTNAEPIGDYISNVAENRVAVGYAPGSGAGCVVINPHAVARSTGNVLGRREGAIHFVKGI